MFVNYTILLVILGCTVLAGCQAEAVSAPQQNASGDLPSEFSETLQTAFQDTPVLTAEGFLSVHAHFAQSGPVTQQAVEDYLRVQMATQQAKTLNDILATDLNGDQFVTRAEYDHSMSLPGGAKNAVRLAGLFAFDKNQDGHISMLEAIDCAENLESLRPQNEIYPLERHLMLFDLDADGQVIREELILALGVHVPSDAWREAEVRVEDMR